jgi:hypothetical protein
MAPYVSLMAIADLAASYLIVVAENVPIDDQKTYDVVQVKRQLEWLK